MDEAYRNISKLIQGHWVKRKVRSALAKSVPGIDGSDDRDRHRSSHLELADDETRVLIRPEFHNLRNTKHEAQHVFQSSSTDGSICVQTLLDRVRQAHLNHVIRGYRRR
ncbi:WD domain protein [Aspergillus luchuensis]|uniref:WD domain protein n=1 Tax=Aspergillus kawachii TaxID=1069201 RepID=A0A146FN10_ASPKA|nr:WD domain protein [Aspergillus luchuensis]